MRLLSRAASDGERLSVLTASASVVDVADLLGRGAWTMARLLADVDDTLAAIRRALVLDRTLPTCEIEDVTLLPPVTRPGKIIAIGRNYADHAAEEGKTAPTDPILFAKLPNALVGHGAVIAWRARDTDQVDYEAELAVVIGRTARDVTVADALDYVLGYTCLDDVSARDLQSSDGQWVRGKSLDTFCPVGPWLVTADEIPDPGALRLRCLVNGEVLQDALTTEMVHDVPALITFCSRFMTLEPGDIIATGTPAGVGAFREPPRFLRDGDEVVIDIERIGQLRNRCRVIGA